MMTSRALAFWQSTEPLTSRDMHLLMIFAGVIAFALLLQSLVIVGAAIKGAQVQKNVMADVAELKAKTLPLLDRSQALAAQISLVTADLTPTLKNITAKVEVIAGHVEHISALAREKAEEFAPTVSAANETVAEANETVRDANRKAQEQVARVNEMVTSVLDATAQAGQAIKRGINIPVQGAAGLVSGFKAAFGVFLRPKPRPYIPQIEFHQPYRALTPSYHEISDVLDEGIPGEPPEQ